MRRDIAWQSAIVLMLAFVIIVLLNLRPPSPVMADCQRDNETIRSLQQRIADLTAKLEGVPDPICVAPVAKQSMMPMRARAEVQSQPTPTAPETTPNLCYETGWQDWMIVDRRGFDDLKRMCAEGSDTAWKRGWYCHPANGSMHNCIMPTPVRARVEEKKSATPTPPPLINDPC